MLDRIEEKQVLANSSAYLDGLIKKHARVDSVSVFFPEILSFQRIPRPYELNTIGAVDQPNWRFMSHIINSNLDCNFVGSHYKTMLENHIPLIGSYDKVLWGLRNGFYHRKQSSDDQPQIRNFTFLQKDAAISDRRFVDLNLSITAHKGHFKSGMIDEVRDGDKILEANILEQHSRGRREFMVNVDFSTNRDQKSNDECIFNKHLQSKGNLKMIRGQNLHIVDTFKKDKEPNVEISVGLVAKQKQNQIREIFNNESNDQHVFSKAKERPPHSVTEEN